MTGFTSYAGPCWRAVATGRETAVLDGGEEPASWAVADQARAIGATGLIDGSRHAPGEWHLVLFRWNVAGGAQVGVAGHLGQFQGSSRE